MASDLHHTLLLTFPHDDRHRVAVLQVPLIRHRQRERVRADLQACYCGNSTVCILNLHTIRTTGG